MKAWVAIVLQLLIIVLAIQFYHSPSSDYELQSSPAICLESANPNVLCVQCYTRDKTYSKHKGYVTNTISEVSVLKIKQPYKELSCSQMAHFVDYANVGRKLYIQKSSPVYELVKEIKAEMYVKSISEESVVIEPQFNSFVVYRWFLPTERKDNQIQKVSEQRLNVIYKGLALLANGVFLAMAATFYSGQYRLKELNSSAKISLLAFAVCIEFLSFNIGDRETFTIFSRLSIAAFCLSFIGLPSWLTLLVCLVGFFLNYFQYGSFSFGLIIFGFFYYIGNSRSDLKNSVFFTLLGLFGLIINYFLWSQMFYYIADGECRIVELCILVVLPIGMIFPPVRQEAVKFQHLQNTDPEFRSISLSGFEDADEN